MPKLELKAAPLGLRGIERGHAARRIRRRKAAFWVVAAAAIAAALTVPAAAGAQTVDEVEQRDQLIANQENLLNTYRCLFGVDTGVVPGQCPNPDTVSPGVAPENPTQNDIDVRDGLIQSQEALLNVYRCRFNVDTQIVLGGCADGMPAPGPAQTPPTAGEVLSADEIYERVAPSVPLIETPSAQGSGILIDGGYVVTNQHVVGFHEEVWVVFPDGTEFEGVPVLAVDFMADLAVLGPIDFDAAALELSDGEDMGPGADLFLIGYPSEFEALPQATITRGILSRFRQWDTYDLTLLQTDAAIAGGQSGGALVNNRGEVVGISTWKFSDAGFGVATSAADDALIVQELIQLAASEDHESGRSIGTQPGEFAYEVDTTFAQAFTFHGSAGTIVNVNITGNGDGYIRVSDASGVLVESDETEAGEERVSFEVVQDGLHFVEVDSFFNDAGDYVFDLASSVRLLPYEDPDDGWELAAGADFEVLYGFFDYFSDLDLYTIQLAAGETLLLYTDSIIADTALWVLGPDGESVADDDDGGPPNAVLPGSANAMVEFSAPTTGEYLIYVEEVLGQRGYGYALVAEILG